MAFDERKQKAFDFAAECAKQLVTLATGIIALTITFSKEFVGGVPNNLRVLAMVGWGAYGLSILFGIAVIHALTGELERKGPDAAGGDPSIWGSPATYAKLQILMFLLGMVLTIVFGIFAVSASPATTQAS